MKRNKEASGEKQAHIIDWGEVHRRLEAAREAIDQGWTPGPEEKKRVLKERAKALSREIEGEKADQEQLEIVEFLLAHERYGVESFYVREVYPLKEFTPLPSTPSFILGIINIRGRILSIIDIKRFFDLPEKGLTDLNRVIVLHRDNSEFGILADAILGVRSIALNEIQPPLPTLTDIREEYLKGITRDRMTILDGEKLLSDKRLIVHEEIET